MKFVYPEINKVFEIGEDFVNTLVIENQGLFCRVIEDIYNQINGFDGKSVLSENNKILPINKNLEVFSQFVPFEMNRKSLVTKVCSAIEAKAMNEEYFYKTSKMISEIEKYLLELSFDFSCSLSFEKMSFASLLKSSGSGLSRCFSHLL